MSNSAFSRLKHDLANPLSAILAETQLLLMRAEELPEDVVESLRAVETGALRMREMLRDLNPG
jgi:signal transduction histidine kinase